MPRAHVRLLASCVAMAVAAVLTAAVEARAEEESPVGRSYAGLGFGYGFENFDRNDATNVDDAVGLDFWMGYRITEFWAIETQLEYMDGFDLTIAGQDGNGQYVAATLNAKIFPFARILPARIEPFLFAGAGAGRIQVNVRSTSDIEEIAFLGRAGGGVDFYIWKDLALQISTSFVQGTQDLNNFSYVSTVVGLQYRF